MKALGFCSRFRFLFFENTSPFSVGNISVSLDTKLKERAREILKELNLLKRDLAEVKLDEPISWIKIDAIDWQRVMERSAIYQPIEQEMREAANLILMSKDSNLQTGKKGLLASLEKLTSSFKSINAEMITVLAANMGKLVHDPSTGTAEIRSGIGHSNHSTQLATP